MEPVHDWEKEERGYIFETRLEKATEMKDAGNEHFRAGEWDLALRSIYTSSLRLSAFLPSFPRAAVYAILPLSLSAAALLLLLPRAS